MLLTNNDLSRLMLVAVLYWILLLTWHNDLVPVVSTDLMAALQLQLKDWDIVIRHPFLCSSFHPFLSPPFRMSHLPYFPLTFPLFCHVSLLPLPHSLSLINVFFFFFCFVFFVVTVFDPPLTQLPWHLGIKGQLVWAARLCADLTGWKLAVKARYGISLIQKLSW